MASYTILKFNHYTPEKLNVETEMVDDELKFIITVSTHSRVVEIPPLSWAEFSTVIAQMKDILDRNKP